jgi:hypothetical protein
MIETGCKIAHSPNLKTQSWLHVLQEEVLLVAQCIKQQECIFTWLIERVIIAVNEMIQRGQRH